MCEIIEKWKKEIRNEGFVDGKQAGYIDGKQAGIALGATITTVQMCKDFGKTPSEVADYLTQKMHLTREQAQDAVQAYW